MSFTSLGCLNVRSVNKVKVKQGVLVTNSIPNDPEPFLYQEVDFNKITSRPNKAISSYTGYFYDRSRGHFIQWRDVDEQVKGQVKIDFQNQNQELSTFIFNVPIENITIDNIQKLNASTYVIKSSFNDKKATLDFHITTSKNYSFFNDRLDVWTGKIVTPSGTTFEFVVFNDPEFELPKTFLLLSIVLWDQYEKNKECNEKANCPPGQIKMFEAEKVVLNGIRYKVICKGDCHPIKK
ncbi:hypothetical protein [Aridibaculum aurantiacum]|uniref:hypothetical protein n=1 Tax=Aridibaculum aurantiacum TaxID=2810307 RepID=UPI001A960D94|nr:hypothetical protein [Aridibaculum aurantiacum]